MANSDMFTDGLVMISRRADCPYCEKMKALLTSAGLKPQIVFSDNIRELFIAKHKSVPQLYFRGEHIGDSSTLDTAYLLNGVEGVRRKALNLDPQDENDLF